MYSHTLKGQGGAPDVNDRDLSVAFVNAISDSATHQINRIKVECNADIISGVGDVSVKLGVGGRTIWSLMHW